MMHRYGAKLAMVALSLALAGAACDGSSPLGPANGSPDSPGDGSGLTQMTGLVESASLSSDDPSEGTFVLEGDIQVRVTSQTTIDGDGDLTTLSEALSALQAGTAVRIEIEGTLEGGVFTATRIRFETEDSGSGPGSNDDDDEDDNGNDDQDDDDDVDEVHGTVASVDLGARTVTLADGRQIRIPTDALIEVDGDFLTLAGVLTAIGTGLEIQLEADGAIGADGVFEVTNAKFESGGADDTADDDEDDDGNDDNGNDDDDDDDDPDEIHGVVASVDLGARIVTLADGRVLRIPSDALIEVDGDLLTLADVSSALGAGLEVRMEADGAISADGVFEVTSAEFESDEAEGVADDEGDDEDEEDDNSGPGPGDDENDDDDEDQDEVEGIVASVDVLARTVTTTAGEVIHVSSDSIIEADGDILTLSGVEAQLALGATIRVEAEGALDGGVFVAAEAEFEID